MISDNAAFEFKKAQLFNYFEKIETIAVALSGGVDSTLLLAMAHLALGKNAIAVTAASATHPSGELELAVELAHVIDVRHIIVETDELADPNFVLNRPDRCYHCKKRLFSTLIERLGSEGACVLSHGANLDDSKDFRPGMKAAEELGVIAPLVQTGFSKSDVRQLAKQLGLPNWDRPSMACLATRIPYGTRIQKELLARIDRAEQSLRKLGVRHCRVRHHGNMARIEVAADEIDLLADCRVREQVVEALKVLGYQYVSLDLEGYQTGKMNLGLRR